MLQGSVPDRDLQRVKFSPRARPEKKFFQTKTRPGPEPEPETKIFFKPEPEKFLRHNFNG